MKNKTIGVAVIGTGRAGMIHAVNFSRNVKHASLVALVDSDPALLGSAAQETGISALYSDFRKAIEENPAIDAIVVTTPTVLHKEIVQFAAERGKHILCEKPMAMDLSECQSMNDSARAARVKLQLGFMRRYDSSFRSAKERIEAGEIGEVVQVKSLTHGPSVPRPWQYDIAKSNGPLAEVNSHDIDTLRWFTGSEFSHVYAIASNYRCPEALPEFPDFYDNVSLLAGFDNGMQGFISGAVSVKYGYDSRVEILGTKGVLFVGSLQENSVLGCSKENGMKQTIISSWMHLFRQAYLEEDRDFIQCILDDRQPVASGIDGMMAVKVVNAGNLSIREKRPVSLQEITINK